MAKLIASISARIHQNCDDTAPAKCGNGMFMPHMPVNTVSGRKIFYITVSSFMTWFIRL